MSHKAVSTQYKAHEGKQFPGQPYVEMDIDRFIGFLKEEILKIDEVLKDPEVTMFDDHPMLRQHFEFQMDSYEGLLSMIEANSFR